jgi:hypothetical protein
MSEKYSSITPYNYCFNNPMNLFDPDGQDPREVGKVLNIDFRRANVISSSHSGNVAFGATRKIYDKQLYDKADEVTFLYALPGIVSKMMKNPGGSLPKGYLDGLEWSTKKTITSSWGDQADAAKGFIGASHSNVYSYVEAVENENGGIDKMIERKVENLGEGFEAEVTYKAEYDLTYDINEEGEIEITRSLSKQTFIGIIDNDGQQQYKLWEVDMKSGQVNITYQDAVKREDNTKGLY